MVWGSMEEPPEEEIEQIINEMKAATCLWAEIMAYCDRCVVSKRTLSQRGNIVKCFGTIP